MGVVRELQVRLTGDNNETFIGKITIETGPIDDGSFNVSVGNYSGLNGDGEKSGLEPDPVGASSYVIAVVLIYGLSIVFLIGSHVMIKNRENHRDNEKQINKFLEQAPVLKEKSAKDSYKSLKHSIIPVVALSPARDLVARRKSFASLLVGLHSAPSSRRGSQEKRGSIPKLLSPEDAQTQDIKQPEVVVVPKSPRLGEDEGRRMSTIEEESESDLDRSQAGSFKDKLRHARQNSVTVPEIPSVPEELESQSEPTKEPPPSSKKKKHSIHEAKFFLRSDSDRPAVHKSSRNKLPKTKVTKDRSSTKPSRHSDPCGTKDLDAAVADKSRAHQKRNSDPGPPSGMPLDLPETSSDAVEEDMWVPSPDISHCPMVALSESPSSAETEHLLHVTCV